MRATILGLIRGEVADPTVESRLENASYPAIDATAYESLDGSAIYAGDAAGRVEVETERVYVTESAITTEREPEEKTAACEWIADLESGWLGVNRSDGEFLFDLLGAVKGVEIHRADIDVDGFAEYLSDYADSTAWNVTQTRSLDDDNDAEESVISYHDAAHLADTGGSRETTMLGFTYWWEGSYTRGVVSESGFVAVFDGADAPSAYAAFINSEILPFAELPEEYQGTFANVSGSTAAADEEVSD